MEDNNNVDGIFVGGADADNESFVGGKNDESFIGSKKDVVSDAEVGGFADGLSGEPALSLATVERKTTTTDDNNVTRVDSANAHDE